MRVDSVFAINDHQQHNPHTVKYAGASTGKTASGLVFEEYLKANIQQISTPEVTRQTESQIAGLLRGYFAPMRIAQKTEPKPEDNAS